MRTRAVVASNISSSRLPGWDALRGLAATGVLVLHASVFRLGDLPLLRDIVSQFQCGVEVFFVVSGFVMSRPFIRAVLDGRPLPGIRRYGWRRVVRIFPAYWLALAGAALLLDTTQFRSVGDWLVHALLLQVYWTDQYSRGIGIAWTLSVEVSFYVLLPIAFVAVRGLASRLSPWAQVTGLGVVLHLVGWCWVLWVVRGDHFLQAFWLPFFLPVFTAGLLLCVAAEYVARNPRARLLANRIGRAAPLWWLGAAGLLLIATVTIGDDALFRIGRLGETQVLYAGIATLLVIPIAIGFQPSGPIGRWLELRPLVFLGVVSYGLYLWHKQLAFFLAVDIFGWTGETQGSALVMTVATFVLSVCVASVSWFAIERPLQRWSRSVFR